MLIKMDAYFDGTYWCAKSTSEDIFTQGKTQDELMKNIKEAVSLHFEDEIKNGKTIEILVISELEVANLPKTATG